jgi:hypothetical protein
MYITLPTPTPKRCPNCGACPNCGHKDAAPSPWVQPWPGYPNPYIGDPPGWLTGGTTGGFPTGGSAIC